MLLCDNTEHFERFQYFTFETNFLKNAILCQKTGGPHFLVESTKIENATFLCKIDWGVQNGPIKKNEFFQ